MKKAFVISYDNIISPENLLAAWEEFLVGKRSKEDVRIFELHLMENILSLHRDLKEGSYKQQPYQAFTISDPKPRNIHKPSVRDRLLHKAIYRKLYPFFDGVFIHDSYSCRNNKGTHKGFGRVVEIARKVSRNYTQPCWALKCDIRKFFDSIDHKILFDSLAEYIVEGKLRWLLAQIIRGFEKNPGKGMPLGNLTSQLFANVYMNPLDQFIKHRLKAHYYVRYADDFLILATKPNDLMGYFIEIWRFLKEELKLELHPSKVNLRRLNWGIDFVGYVALPHYNLPRAKTVKRAINRLGQMSSGQLANSLPSYLGHLGHVDSFELRKSLACTFGNPSD